MGAHTSLMLKGIWRLPFARAYPNYVLVLTCPNHQWLNRGTIEIYRSPPPAVTILTIKSPATFDTAIGFSTFGWFGGLECHHAWTASHRCRSNTPMLTTLLTAGFHGSFGMQSTWIIYCWKAKIASCPWNPSSKKLSSLKRGTVK